MVGSALDHVNVLDLTGGATAPLADALLVHGAHLVLVEAPSGGAASDTGLPSVWPDSASLSSIRLDLTCGPDRDILIALARDAGVLLEGWRAGIADILRLGYHAMREFNQAMVYVSLRDGAIDGEDAIQAIEAALLRARDTGAGSHLVLGAAPSDEVGNPR